MQLAEFIANNEGFVDHVYRCPAGKLSIGYGRNLQDVGLTPSEKSLLGIPNDASKEQVIKILRVRKISKEEATQLLNNDITRVRDYLSKYNWFTKQNDHIQMAIIDMGFNMGVGALLKFKKMIYYLERDQYMMAGYEASNSRWFKQVGIRAMRDIYLIYHYC